MATLHFHCLSILLLQLFSRVAVAVAASHCDVKYVPGFQGPLPFHLETGYIGIGESEEVQLFYYFIESEGDPLNDPLILWLIGGPGCSALSGVALDMGPLNFKQEEPNGSLPTLVYNPHSWTKKSSMIFIDLPVGTGFSYAKTQQARKTGDLNQAQHSHQFLRKWLINHPEFISNEFYVGADSYAGLIAPMVVQEIISARLKLCANDPNAFHLEGNKYTLPYVNLQGYILGNPFTIRNSSFNFEVPFAHRMTLISDELFELLEVSCRGEYANIDPSNVECLKHYETFKKCISRLDKKHILLPYCLKKTLRRSLHSIPESFPNQLEDQSPELSCIIYDDALPHSWANHDEVRKALHIREGTIKEWIRCNYTLDYDYHIDNVVPYHKNFSSQGFRSLIFSGDHDMSISHLDTQAWIKSLNYSIVDDWRPWFIEHQVAGYTKTYSNKMTFTTIKGGGHTISYTPKECYAMFSRWISGKSL